MANICGLGMDDDFVRRMRNWARYRGGEGYSVQAVDYSRDVVDQRYREASMPIMCGEARDTEAAMSAVLGVLIHKVVAQFWVREGASWRDHAKALDCNHETARARVEVGHEQLQRELYRRAHIYRVIGEANRVRSQTQLNAA